eukprot:3348712-Pleurochrysis_carterae.AAC.2
MLEYDITLIKRLLSFPSCKTQTTSMLRRELPVLNRNAALKMLFQSKPNEDCRCSQQSFMAEVLRRHFTVVNHGCDKEVVELSEDIVHDIHQYADFCRL